MAKTDENLKAAFADESQANRLYLTFAKKADEEGRHMLDLQYAKRKIHENKIDVLSLDFLGYLLPKIKTFF